MKKLLALLLVICTVLIIISGCKKVDEPIVTETTAAVEQVPAQAPEGLPVVETEETEPVVTIEAKTEVAKNEEEKTVVPAKTEEPEEEEEKQNIVAFTDSLGKTIILNKNPQRVVCLHTSYLDLWDLAGGKVVGRADTKESVPEAAKNVETVGLYTTPNLEKILSLQPDLILLNSEVNSHVALIPIFEKNNIPYAALKYNTFKDYVKMLRIYTELTDREDLYQSKGVEVAKKIDAIIARIPKDRKPSILLLLGSTKSVSVRLPDTTVGEMLQDLGTVNIAYDKNLKEGDMEVFSMERVIEKDPDFIFAQTMGDIEETTARIKKDIESNPAWSYLNAVKEGKYIFLPKDLFLFKPNDRYSEAYEVLARMLYPDIFN
jgi:iron complex transport system substrate-binding protein